MRLPRIVHKIYARLFGYFWLPCPLCGKWTGGHEWKDPLAEIYVGRGRGIGTCDACAPRAWEMSKPARLKEGITAIWYSEYGWLYVTDDPAVIREHKQMAVGVEL